MTSTTTTQGKVREDMVVSAVSFLKNEKVLPPTVRGQQWLTR